MYRSSLLRAAFGLSTLALAGCGDVTDERALDPPVAEAEQALTHANLTSGFAPVVRIQSTFSNGTSRCTATAISDSVLVTSSSCLKHENSKANYTTILAADGANASAVGATSSYYMLSEIMWNHVYYGDVFNEAQASRDLALIKFGAGTFDAAYPMMAVPDTLSRGDRVVMVGYGGDGRKRWGDNDLDSIYTPGGPTSLIVLPYGDGDTDIESGDMGGPALISDGNGGWAVIGANSTTAWHTAITEAFYDLVTPILDDMDDKLCFHAFEHTSHRGDSWAFCLTSSIGNRLDDFADPWMITHRDDFGHWNDEISSLLVPPDMHVTAFEHSGQGGDRVTVQNMFEFGSNGDVGNLLHVGFNDKVSSFRWVRNTNAGSASMHIEITRYGKCLDLRSGQTHNGANIQQWDCQNGNSNEIFKIVPVGSAYQVKHASSGKCLDVAGGNTASGTNIQLWSCNTSNQNQLFEIESNPDTSDPRDFTIRNVRTDKCVDLAYGGTANGTNIHQWGCNDGPSQNFALEKRW